jgi:hypothetical protein
MKVRATAPGFHGAYREEGDEFEVGANEEATWFEPVKTKKQDVSVDADTNGKDKNA